MPPCDPISVATDLARERGLEVAKPASSLTNPTSSSRPSRSPPRTSAAPGRARRRSSRCRSTSSSRASPSDESGDLWLTLSQGKIGYLDGAQLTATASVTPNVILTSADIGNAVSLAFYPAATGTPLYAATLP